jgi:hypothetical protein
VQSVMRETGQPVKDILSKCSDIEESQVLDAIRFLIDNDVLQYEKDGTIRRKGNKKSRH